MRLRKFEIRNYKAIESLSFEWDDIVVLIGENNCGKSSVLSALSHFLGGGGIKDESLFRRHLTDKDHAIELIGTFDQLSDWDLQQVAVRGRVHNNEWILKKQFWLESEQDQERSGWKEQLFTFSASEVFTDWPESDAAWNSFPAQFQPLIQQIPNRPARPNVAARETLKQLIRAGRPDLVAASEPDWIANPGGGGNWKSNANSIVPKAIFIRAVHEATDETAAKDASTYGRLINLIVERQLAQRPEMTTLQNALNSVLQLFRPNAEHPEQQAEEIRQLQERINAGLGQIIGGQALIRTEPPELRSLVMPSTSLVIRDTAANIETHIAHQGHGLQRTLVMTLLQLLAESQDAAGGDPLTGRSTVLIVEEPELYLHPQMERLMRDVLYRLAGGPRMQVACCTHSPIFIDIAQSYKSIVRIMKQPNGNATAMQIVREIFPNAVDAAAKEQIQTVARFHPTINELFFARNVVLFEEFSAIAALERWGDLSGLFVRHARVRRETTLVDCNGKANLPAFQKMLNAFSIPYRVVHDLDTSNPTAFAENARIHAALPPGAANAIHAIAPEDLEGLLGHTATKRHGKVYGAVRRIEELHAQNAVPVGLTQALNMTFFGQIQEPAA